MKPTLNQPHRLAEQLLGQPLQNLAPLRAYQLDALNQTLERLRRSAFFARRLRGYPTRLGSLAELQELPLCAAEDLAAHDLADFLCLPPHQIARIVTLFSSGSTGPPKRVAFTEADLALTVQYFAWGMRELTAAGERVLICMPGSHDYGISHLLAEDLRKLGAEPRHYGMIQDVADAWRVLCEFQPHCLVGLPVQMLALSAYAARRAAAYRGPRALLLSADYLPEALRTRLAANFQCTVFNHYGSTEMNYGAALECGAHDGLHLRENDLLFEVIDPATGHRLPPGATGEVVFSTLTRGGMPLLRYRTGDFARWLPGVCACGSCLPRLSSPRRRAGCLFNVQGREQQLQDWDELLFQLPGLLDYRVQPTEQGVRLDYWTEHNQPLSQTALRAALAPLPGGADWRIEFRLQTEEPPPGFLGKRLVGKD